MRRGIHCRQVDDNRYDAPVDAIVHVPEQEEKHAGGRCQIATGSEHHGGNCWHKARGSLANLFRVHDIPYEGVMEYVSDACADVTYAVGSHKVEYECGQPRYDRENGQGVPQPEGREIGRRR